MTEFRRITDIFAVAPQLSADDVRRAKAEGYTMILCNRPDEEDPGQPGAHEIEAVAETEGLKFAWIPISSGGPTAAAIHETRNAMHATDGPILAYCRSGTRSCMLWSLAEAMRDDMTTPDILQATQKAGYDMGAIAGLLEQVRSQGF